MTYFDKFYFSIIKESPDSIKYKGDYIDYCSTRHITGLMMSDDNSKFICTSFNNPAKIVGHSNFIHKLTSQFKEIENSIVTNFSKNEIDMLRNESISIRSAITSAIRFRIFNTKEKYFSFWGKMTPKKFKGALVILDTLKLDPSTLRWDVSLRVEDDENLHKKDEYKHYPSKIFAEVELEQAFTPYYTYKQLDEFFSGLNSAKQKKLKEEEEQRRKEQEELEKQIKLKSLGFTSKPKRYWE